MELIPQTIIPSLSQFTFTVGLPDGWVKVDVPGEQPDFSDPGKFLLLAVYVHNPTYSVFAAAVRPGYGDGTVLQWLQYLAGQQNWTVERLEPFGMGPHRAASAIAVQPNEDGPTRARACLFEDAGNLFTVSAMTSLENWEKQAGLFDEILSTFALAQVKGSTVPLAPDEAPASSEPTTKTYADFALADDYSSVDPEHPMNRNIREAGHGFVPNRSAVDLEGKSVTLAAGAIVAAFKIPFGWHALDDGRRTLVFAPDNSIQINFERINAGETPPEQVLQTILDGLVQESPEVKSAFSDLGGMPCMVIRDLVSGGETLQQVYVLKALNSPGHYLKCRMTSTSGEGLVRAGDLFELVIRDMQFLS